MKDILNAIWDFPANNIALGWWLAAALTLWNVIASVSGRALNQVVILSRKFRKDQLTKRLKNLEYLHENTNALVRYLASDAVDVAIEASWICISFTILLIRFIPVKTSGLFAIILINIGTSVIGRAWRIRTMLNDLRNYAESTKSIKAKLERL
jgi:hypothetical protein